MNTLLADRTLSTTSDMHSAVTHWSSERTLSSAGALESELIDHENMMTILAATGSHYASSSVAKRVICWISMLVFSVVYRQRQLVWSVMFGFFCLEVECNMTTGKPDWTTLALARTDRTEFGYIIGNRSVVATPGTKFAPVPAISPEMVWA